MALRIPAVFAGCAAVLAAALWVLWQGLYYRYSTDSVLALMFLLGCALALAGAGYLFARQLKDSRGVADIDKRDEYVAYGDKVIKAVIG